MVMTVAALQQKETRRGAQKKRTPGNTARC